MIRMKRAQLKQLKIKHKIRRKKNDSPKYVQIVLNQTKKQMENVGAVVACNCLPCTLIKSLAPVTETHAKLYNKAIQIPFKKEISNYL